MAHTLILLRHGESDWNQKNLFTGWVDVDLTDKGRAEAARGGQLLKDAGILPDVVHTSVLRRAITTANLALDAADRHWIPVRRSWRLNERHYGALQGLDKAATRDKYGDEQFMLWRRSFDTPPPPIEAGSEFDQTSDPRYAGVDVPLTECLADVIPRMMPYWENDIQADLATARSCSSPPTATACGLWSSTSTASATRTSPASTSPPACRWSTSSDDDFMPTGAGRVPRPRGGCGGRGSGGEPGALSRRGSSQSVALAGPLVWRGRRGC
jgi:2,3-bisphosphoglycerate-dependent phosphoglycerate mutase